MAIITPPKDIPVRQDSWRLTTPSEEVVSGWTGKRQVLLIPGPPRWSATIDIPPRNQTEGALWRAFFASLKGRVHQFQLKAEAFQQYFLSNPLVNGAGQVGGSLNIDGLTNTAGTKFLLPGAFATISLPSGGKQLLMLTNVTNTTAGAATITFEPQLRESPADNALLEVQNPYALVSLREDFFEFSRDTMLFHGFSLNVAETF